MIDAGDAGPSLPVDPDRVLRKFLSEVAAGELEAPGGLRPHAAVERFHLLKYGLAIVLMFVGLKMVWLNDAFGGELPIGWCFLGTLPL